MSETALPLLELSLEHIKKMLLDAEEPCFPQEGQELPSLQSIHEYLAGLRGLLKDFSKGNLSGDIMLRGSLAGNLKALQSNLLHLTWQIQQVAAGDFRHRVDFMGEFSDAFNSMVVQLDSALTTLREHEDELIRLTGALQQEIELKNQAMAALGRSEASFRYMAEHDTLTGVLNRRCFYDRAMAELERAKVSGKYCGIAIFDIDYFKTFNDSFGHLNGDLALKHVADIARDTLRANDILGRFGGDEFVIFLLFKEGSTGKTILERVRRAVSNAPVVMDEKESSITISVGLICIPPDLEEARDISFLKNVLRVADTALYTAKAEGRNRVSVRIMTNTKDKESSAHITHGPMADV